MSLEKTISIFPVSSLMIPFLILHGFPSFCVVVSCCGLYISPVTSAISHIAHSLLICWILEDLYFKIYFSFLHRSEVVHNDIVIDVATSKAFNFDSIAGVVICYFTEQVLFFCWETNTTMHIVIILYWKVEVLTFLVFWKL